MLLELSNTLNRQNVSPRVFPSVQNVCKDPRVTIPQLGQPLEEVSSAQLQHKHTIISPQKSHDGKEPRVHLEYPGIKVTSLLPLPMSIPALCPKVQHNTFMDSNVTKNATESLHHIFDESGKRLTIDKLINGNNQKVWRQRLPNEFGRLPVGFKSIKGTNTINFIRKESIPKHKKITYANMVCDHRPLKTEKYRVRLTIGGD